MEDEEVSVGTPVWFPTSWEYGVIDSILRGPDGKVIAYIVERDDGSKLAVDMQMPTFGETVQ